MIPAAAIWPHARLPDAVLALARAAGLPVDDGGLPPIPAAAQTAQLIPWLRAASRALHLDLQPVQLQIHALNDFVQHSAPAIFVVDGGLLAVVRGTALLGPDLQVRRVSAAVLREALLQPNRARIAEGYPTLLDDLGPVHGAAVQQVWMRQLDIVPGFLLRLPGDASLWAQARDRGLPRLLIQLLALQACMTGLGFASGWLGAVRALSGRMTTGDVALWTLLSLTVVPPLLLAVRVRGELSLGMGLIFRRRLLAGILKLHPDEVRVEGVGGHLGRLIDAAEVESLALGAGLGSFTALVDVAAAAVVVTAGPAGLAGGAVLAALAAGVVMATAVQWRRQRDWTAARIGLTSAMVERMVGHRTRVASLAPGAWSREEDVELEAYTRKSAALDSWSAGMAALGGGLWPVFGLLLLDPQRAALGLAGLLVGTSALAGLMAGMGDLIAAFVAWERLAPLWHAANRAEVPGDVHTTLTLQTLAAPGSRVLDAQAVSFQYEGRAPVLRDVHLQLHVGDRLLLEGPSGGGKSTLAALLAALRRPDAGVILLRGYDLPSAGEATWRRLVATAPQFHENHIFSQSLAFNLLMGSGWPPTEAQLAEARALCTELGLGPLLERMPAGMRQQVGETGWQLSHGERSRVFLARALLQRAEVVILDENFGALDPETQQAALRTAWLRARTLVVIAHP